MKHYKIHTWNAMRQIAHVVKHITDDEARWFKVNWIIVHTSHKINNKPGKHGHVVRQEIRHKLWNIAQQKYPVLQRYVIPLEISGDSKPAIRSPYTSQPSKPIGVERKYYHKNVPAIIAAIIIGFFIILVPIIDRKTLYENIYPILTYFNPESFSSVLILISMLLVLAIFCLFLLNGLGIKPNRYSKYAGYLSILYFSLIFLESVFFIGNTNQVSVSGITFIPYWISSFGVSIIGIVYLIFFEVFHWYKKNPWKIVTFTIVCAVSLFLIGIFMPIILASTGLLISGQFGGLSYSANSKYQFDEIATNSKYHVGEIATNQNGQQGLAITSDDGQGYYTVVPVYLDNSQKGWHTNGKVDSQIVAYQKVEQQYSIAWFGGRMDITHIPDRDWSLLSSTGSSSNIVITTPPTVGIPTTVHRTTGTTVPIDEIINRHNYYRNSISGVHMPNLVWSSTIAASAQSYADYLGANNIFEHSKSQYGENLAAGYSSWTSAIDRWGSEKSNFLYAPFGNGASKTGNWKDIGHYTQVIWSTTTHCGCGSAPHGTYGTVYVCQYSPPGNYDDRYPY